MSEIRFHNRDSKGDARDNEVPIKEETALDPIRGIQIKLIARQYRLKTGKHRRTGEERVYRPGDILVPTEAELLALGDKLDPIWEFAPDQETSLGDSVENRQDSSTSRSEHSPIAGRRAVGAGEPRTEVAKGTREIWEKKRTCTQKEASEIIGVHPKTIRRKIAKGFLKTTSDGSRVLISSVREYLGIK